MAHRKANSEKTDFASQLIRLGFIQQGECTVCGATIKVFRTNKTHSEQKRYWQVEEIRTRKVLFKSGHCSEVLEYIRHSQFYINGATLTFRIS